MKQHYYRTKHLINTSEEARIKHFSRLIKNAGLDRLEAFCEDPEILFEKCELLGEQADCIEVSFTDLDQVSFTMIIERNLAIAILDGDIRTYAVELWDKWNFQLRIEELDYHNFDHPTF